MDKKHLFILQDENNNVTIETYTTDDSGDYSKGKTVEMSVSNVNADTRLPLLEAAIRKKIKLQHKLELGEYQLSVNISEVLEKLMSEGKITVKFYEHGRPPDDSYVPFVREEKEIDFSFNQMTNSAYDQLERTLENAVKTPLSKFNEIYISEDLLKKNALFELLKTTYGENKVVSNKESVTSRNTFLKGLEIMTESDIYKIKQAQKEKDHYDNLEVELVKTTMTLRDKINACNQSISIYPNSTQTDKIRAKLKGFQDDEAWEKAKTGSKVKDYNHYLGTNNGGAYVHDAQKAIENIKKEEEELEKQKVKRIEQELRDEREERQKGEENSRKLKKRLSYASVAIAAVLVIGFVYNRLIADKSPSVITNPNPNEIIFGDKTKTEPQVIPVSEKSRLLTEQITCTLNIINEKLKQTSPTDEAWAKLRNDSKRLELLLKLSSGDYGSDLEDLNKLKIQLYDCN